MDRKAGVLAKAWSQCCVLVQAVPNLSKQGGLVIQGLSKFAGKKFGRNLIKLWGRGGRCNGISSYLRGS